MVDFLQSLVIKHKFLWREFEAKQDFILFYSGQVPLGGIILISGEAKMLTRDRRESPIPLDHPLFIKELLHSHPLKKSLYLKQGAKVLFVDRFTLLKL